MVVYDPSSVLWMEPVTDNVQRAALLILSVLLSLRFRGITFFLVGDRFQIIASLFGVLFVIGFL